MNENYSEFYRHKRVLGLRIIFSWLCFPLLCFTFNFLPIKPDVGVNVAGVIAGALMIYSSLKWGFLRCPRCKNYYFVKVAGRGNTLSSKCMNCSLENEKSDKEQKIEKYIFVLVFILLVYIFFYVLKFDNWALFR
jgi:hypothetical protein